MKNSQQSQNVSFNIRIEDIERCHEILGIFTWQALAGQKIFITGGTGFIGKWLLATLLHADKALGLNCKISVLSRNPLAFQRDYPKVSGCIDLIKGDVRDFDIDQRAFDVIIHAATDVIAQLSPQDVFSSCVDGTRRVLSLAHRCGARQLLLVSSGAVYGPLPVGMTHVPETYLGGPDPLLSDSAYGEGKRVSEWLVSQAAANGMEIKIARVFSLVGTHLSLEKHFAIGNFLRSALDNKDIIIRGDGTPHRSYLYAADMAAWLWAVLLRGKCGHAYNIGSDESISIADLAKRICQVLERNLNIIINEEPRSKIVSHYVPDISKAIKGLCLPQPMPLDFAICQTVMNFVS